MRREFTLLELLVALAAAVVVTLGIYLLYAGSTRAFVARDPVLEAQRAARGAIESLTQDVLRAGYKVPATAPAVVHAAPRALTVEYFNDQADRYERVRYVLDGSSRLVRQVLRRAGADWTAPPESVLTEVVAEHVHGAAAEGAPALAFAYVAQAPLDVTAPLNVASGEPATIARLRGIRRVEITLTVRSGQPDPVTGGFVYRTLRAEVLLRHPRPATSSP